MGNSTALLNTQEAIVNNDADVTVCFYYYLLLYFSTQKNTQSCKVTDFLTYNKQINRSTESFLVTWFICVQSNNKKRDHNITVNS